MAEVKFPALASSVDDTSPGWATTFCGAFGHCSQLHSLQTQLLVSLEDPVSYLQALVNHVSA